MALPDPDVLLDRIIAFFGGREALLDAMETRIAKLQEAWSQDTDRIGRVLRAHLVVEHFLTEYLEARNPSLGSLDRARLSYAQKVELLNPADRLAGFLMPGLRLLGQIRNRAAHRLRVELNDEDRDGFLNIELFRAMREASVAKGFNRPFAPEDDTHLVVLEAFARFAAGALHAGADPDARLWKAAFESDPSAPAAADTSVSKRDA